MEPCKELWGRVPALRLKSPQPQDRPSLVGETEKYTWNYYIWSFIDLADIFDPGLWQSRHSCVLWKENSTPVCLPTLSTVFSTASLPPPEGQVSTHQASPPFQLGVPQFNPVLTLTPWRKCQSPQDEGSVPQDWPPPTSDANSKSRLLPLTGFHDSFQPTVSWSPVLGVLWRLHYVSKIC